jgi:hypothetical protein
MSARWLERSENFATLSVSPSAVSNYSGQVAPDPKIMMLPSGHVTFSPRGAVGLEQALTTKEATTKTA